MRDCCLASRGGLSIRPLFVCGCYHYPSGMITVHGIPFWRKRITVALLNGLALPVHGLAWLGRQGTRAIGVLVLAGIVVPPIGNVLKPFVTEAIFLLLCISFMRVDIVALREHLRRPVIILAVTGWTTLGVPLIISVGCLVSGIDTHSPDLFL